MRLAPVQRSISSSVCRPVRLRRSRSGRSSWRRSRISPPARWTVGCGATACGPSASASTAPRWPRCTPNCLPTSGTEPWPATSRVDRLNRPIAILLYDDIRSPCRAEPPGDPRPVAGRRAAGQRHRRRPRHRPADRLQTSEGAARGRVGEHAHRCQPTHLRPAGEPLLEVDDWLLPYRQQWAGRLDALEQFLDNETPTTTRRNSNDFSASPRRGTPRRRHGRVCATSVTCRIPSSGCGGHSPTPTNCGIGCPSTSSANASPAARREGHVLARCGRQVSDPGADDARQDPHWDPPRTFSWKWATDTLIFELHPTRRPALAWCSPPGWSTPTAGVEKTAAGYHVCLDQLVSLVETDKPPPFIDADPTEYEKAYAYLAE